MLKAKRLLLIALVNQTTDLVQIHRIYINRPAHLVLFGGVAEPVNRLLQQLVQVGSFIGLKQQLGAMKACLFGFRCPDRSPNIELVPGSVPKY